MKTLMENLSSAASDKTVRSIVVRGEGKVFCSGHSLKELTSETSYEEHLAIFTTCEEHKHMQATQHYKKVISHDQISTWKYPESP